MDGRTRTSWLVTWMAQSYQRCHCAGSEGPERSTSDPCPAPLNVEQGQGEAGSLNVGGTIYVGPLAPQPSPALKPIIIWQGLSQAILKGILLW